MKEDDGWDKQRAAMFDAWQKQQEAKTQASTMYFNAKRRHLGGDSWVIDVMTDDERVLYAVADFGLENTYAKLRKAMEPNNHKVVKLKELLEIVPARIWYSLHNGGDGSAYPMYFLTEAEADYDQMNLDEGWGECCIGPVETFIDSITYLEAVENSKELEERCKF